MCRCLALLLRREKMELNIKIIRHWYSGNYSHHLLFHTEKFGAYWACVYTR